MFSLIYDLILISNTDQECGSTWSHRYGFVLQGEKSGIGRSHCEHKSFRKTWKARRDCVGDCISVRRRGKLGQWANLEGEWGDDGWLGDVGSCGKIFSPAPHRPSLCFHYTASLLNISSSTLFTMINQNRTPYVRCDIGWL
jgi:hypothetical protein